MKTRIVHCQQDDRPRITDRVEFTFLGYTFRPRRVHTRTGQLRTSFVPAVSRAACKAMAAVIRGWRLGRRTNLSFSEVATMINRIVTGWINYYGRFYKSQLIHFLRRHINPHLIKWACRKYKPLHRNPAKARARLALIASTNPRLFAHWRFGAIPTGSTAGAV